jgi:hypothetical protein
MLLLLFSKEVRQHLMTFRFAAVLVTTFFLILISLFVGILVNLLTISFAGGPPLDMETLPVLGWTVILALLYLSAFLMIGMAASALTGRPAVALIVLLVFWVVVAVATPGVARLLCGQFLDVPSQDEVRAEQERVSDEIEDSYPPGTFNFTGNPFDENMPKRAEASGRMAEAEQTIYDRAVALRVDQIYLAYRFAAVSPTGLLTDGFQTLSGTGIHGLEQLLDNAERYRKGLMEFVKSRDAMDRESAHLIYAATASSERNTFSTEEVPASDIPKTEELWSASGLSKERPWPLWQCLFLLLYNLAAGFIALVALLRYDPR